MPPLFFNFLEAMLDHQVFEQFSFFKAFFRNELAVLMGGLSEEIPMGLHKDSAVVVVLYFLTIVESSFDYLDLFELLANRNDC